ncbi:MAG: triose-phosphate isomerase [Spiribacter sp.]|jgi:triosephosphate isomerase|nr:triose-phosphate isomerase [Spiribacter sp.]MDR9490118.1 triose-phosphate isomerase [Spiribacter sp.]
MRTPLVVGNWKMHGLLADAQALAASVVGSIDSMTTIERAVCPPFVHLQAVANVLEGSGVGLGAQNCSASAQGAHTGDIAAEMLADLGVGYVILGHSERRAYDQETHASIAKRYIQALDNGMTPILCVGETLAERDAEQTESVVAEQISEVAERLGHGSLAKAVIAYEPVWAIGTGRTATAEQAQSVHAFIRDRLRGVIGDAAESTRLLYGGSMKPDNADALLAQPDVDGGLIGGAALKADDFAAICAAAARG